MMSVIRCKTLLQTETILVNQGGSGTIVCPVMNFGLLAGGLAKITTLILIPKGLLWPDYQPTPSLSQHHISDTPFTTPFTRVVIYIYIYKSSSQTPAPRVDSDPRHDRSGTAIRLPISWGGLRGQCRHKYPRHPSTFSEDTTGPSWHLHNSVKHITIPEKALGSLEMMFICSFSLCSYVEAASTWPCQGTWIPIGIYIIIYIIYGSPISRIWGWLGHPPAT